MEKKLQGRLIGINALRRDLRFTAIVPGNGRLAGECRMSTTKGSNRSASNGAGMRAAGVPDFAAMTLGGERSLKAMATA
ncbi:MAG: hypothetical protein AAFW01_18350, partial [Pseudomonadota bacterium]